MDDLDKRLARLRKLLAHAAGNANPHEALVAAKLAVEYLDKHPLPVRWFVRKGVACHVAPSLDLTNPTALARVLRPNIPMRRDNWFLEMHRIKDQQVATEALSKGYFCYQRHGFTVFVPARAVEVYV